MSFLIALSITIYVFIAIVVLGIGLGIYTFERGIGLGKELTMALRIIKYSPLWPLLLGEYIRRIAADMREHL